MRMVSSYICLKEVRFHAFHGVMPQERRVGADFLLSLRVGYDFSKAMRTDKVGDTLNYAEVCRIVKEEMDKPSALLEHVAGRIADAIFRQFPDVRSIDLELTKQNPPMGADCEGAGVELHLINDKTLE
ncbi:MAG: dihydroneopterin aldolase [Prevotella sp.]|nr:dihydroneopterin aldolase [Prevotella sp.]